MSNNRPWRELLAELPLMALLGACSAYPFVAALDLRLSIWEVLAACAALLLPLSALLFRTRVAILTGIAASVLAVAATALLLFSDSAAAESIRSELDSFIGWAAPYLKGFRTENPHNARLLGLLFTSVITVPVCLFTVRRMDPFAALLPGLSCILALFIIGHEIHIPTVFGFLLAALLYALYGRYRRHAGAYPPGKLPGPAVFLASVLPVALAVMAAAMVLSSLVKMDPDWMKEIRDKLTGKENPVTDYVVKQSGTVVNASELGGVPVLDGTVLMRVLSPAPDLYLKGMSKDVYTGHSWERSETTKSAFLPNICNFTDTLESLTAMNPVKPMTVDVTDAFSKAAVQIEYVNFPSSLVYLPLKSHVINTVSGDAETGLVGKDMVMLGTAAPNGFTYTATFYVPERESNGFKLLIDQCRKGFYTDNSKYLTADLPVLMRKAEETYAQYLQLPGGLPDRVRELASGLTAGLANDYEKAKAIEDYLSANYTYTLTPGGFDKSRDFVDQFLFESREGYCTYFATSMAVLLRCAGIPSRYVEGYVLPDAQVDGIYPVTRRQGHAWTEAYFEGLGWLQFEPTSAYAGGARPTIGPQPTPSAAPTSQPPATPPPAAQPLPQQDPNVSARIPEGVLWVAGSLLMVLLLLTAAYGVYRRAGLRMKRLSPRDAAVTLFGQYMHVLVMQGIILKNGEELHEFAHRVEKACPLPSRSFAKAVEIFQLARYSNHEITDMQKQQMLDMRAKLLLACRKKIGLFRSLYLKWIWGDEK